MEIFYPELISYKSFEISTMYSDAPFIKEYVFPFILSTVLIHFLSDENEASKIFSPVEFL